MRPMDLDARFLRFRDHGDAAALGQVFDATAPELLRIARHLAGDAAAAEDLVQATYLTALEKARNFEPGRRVLPWLVGILVRHARHARRTERRRVDVERLVNGVPPDPADVAAGREVEREVERALDALPRHYRDLLRPRLQHGERARDAAQRTGRDAGVVRMQVSRGLALLRALLPAGVAGALLLSPAARQALARVRGRVLDQASAAGGAAATPIPGAWLGGIVMVKKVILAAVVLVLTAGAFWLSSPADPEETAVLPPEPARTQVLAPAEAPARAEAVPPADVDAPATGPAAEAVDANAWDPWLCTLTGRLLAADGAPIAGTRVALLELHVDALLGTPRIERLIGAPNPLAALDETVTGADGAFSLRGAQARGLHALGVDLGGPAATLRMVDRSLEPGATVDLGAVVLEPRVELTGTIVDEDGDPVAGARVMGLPAAVPLELPGVHHLDPGALVLHGTPPVALPVPPWLGEWWERLPVPTARTDASGRYRMHVRRGTVTLWCQHERHVAATRGVVTGPGPVREAGELAVPAGRTLSGSVTDAASRPCAGVEVFAGALPQWGDTVIASGPRITDAQGRFEIGPLPEFADLRVAVRTDAAAAWSIHEVGDVDHAEIRLAAKEGEAPPPDRVASGLELVVHVAAAAGGEPVAGARVVVTGAARGTATTGPEGSARAALLLDPTQGGGALEVRVEHPAYAPTSRTLDPGTAEIEIRLPVTGRIEGRVALSGAPSPRPLLILVWPDDGFLGLMNEAPRITAPDPAGDFVVTDLAPGRYLYQVNPHFLAGDAMAALPAVIDPPEPLAHGEVQVTSGETTRLDLDVVTADSALACRVHGRVTLDGAPLPAATVVVAPESEGAGTPMQAAAVERTAATAADGSFEVKGVAPGKVTVRVRICKTEKTADGFLTRCPYHAFEPIELAPGSSRSMDLALVTVRLEVRVVAGDGQPVPDAQVVVTGAEAANRAAFTSEATEASGMTTVTLYRPGRHRVQAYSASHGLAVTEVDLPRPGVLELQLEPGVPCAGRVVVPDAWWDQQGFAACVQLEWERDGTPRSVQDVLWSAADAGFQVPGVSPGVVRATFTKGDFTSAPLEFTLPPQGNTGLVLDFTRP